MPTRQGRILLADKFNTGVPVVDARTIPPKMMSERHLQEYFDLFKTVAIVDFTNVLAYFLETGSDRWKIQDMSGLRLPYPEMWFECDNEVRRKTESPDSIAANGRSALLALEVPDTPIGDLMDVDLGWLRADLPPTVTVQQYHAFHWFKRGIPGLQVPEVKPGEEILVALGSAGLVVDKAGTPLSQVNAMTLKGPDPRDYNYIEDMADVMGADLFPALLSVQLMNCRNVKLVAQEPDAHFSKVRQKRTGKPLLRFHTVQVEIAREVLEREGGLSSNGWKNALHICRGSIAHYTAEKPLFGHYVGPVWRPAHVKGEYGSGIVAKDYEFKAPKKAKTAK